MKRFRGVAVIAGLALFGGIIALSGSAPAGAGQFPGTNGKIVYSKYLNSCSCDNIWVMNADGTGDTQLTNTVWGDFSPSWSPDGTRITFQTNRDGNGEVYVMNADGTGQTRLTNNAAYDVLPSWSPDGTHITFNSNRDGNNEIYVMNADGTGQTNISNNYAYDFSPSWSPDGTQIAFTSGRDGTYQIYVMNADGTGQTNISNNAAYDFLPSWSPDGARITFNSTRDGAYQIYVMNADGTGQTRLTNNAAYDGSPSWSPDGTHITFNSNRDGNDEIYVMNADGTGQTNISNNAANESSPSWQSIPPPTLSSNANPSVKGQPVTFTATTTIVMTGKLFFYDGATLLATKPVVGGTATLVKANLSVGNHSLTVVYKKTAASSPSTSAVLVQQVNPASTTTTLASSLNPSVSGQSVTVKATVTTVSPGTGIPTGTVDFYDNGSLVASRPPRSITSKTSMVFTLIVKPTVGTHTYTAVYNPAIINGTNNHGSSTTASGLDQIVN